MNRLMPWTVWSGLMSICRLAISPTNRSPSALKPTTLGVTRPPSSLMMTLGSPRSMKAHTELVVPRSMPMMVPIPSPSP